MQLLKLPCLPISSTGYNKIAVLYFRQGAILKSNMTWFSEMRYLLSFGKLSALENLHFSVVLHLVDPVGLEPTIIPD